MNKRGSSGTDNALLQTVIFIVLNLIFFSTMITFAFREASGTSTYEQGFAKEIALMIDESKPGMTLWIDISKANEIAMKNKFTGEIIKIDNEKRSVIMQLSKDKGYNFEYFRNYDVSYEVKQKGSQKYLTITVGERK